MHGPITELVLTHDFVVDGNPSSSKVKRNECPASRTGVRYDTSCWSRSSFGTALIEVETRASTRGTLDLRADLRILYAQGGPWHETQWPAKSGR